MCLPITLLKSRIGHLIYKCIGMWLRGRQADTGKAQHVALLYGIEGGFTLQVLAYNGLYVFACYVQYIVLQAYLACHAAYNEDAQHAYASIIYIRFSEPSVLRNCEL